VTTPRSLLWAVGDEAFAQSVGAVLGDVTVVAVHLDATRWPLPTAHRPVGVVLHVLDADDAARVAVRTAHQRSAGCAVLVLTDRTLPAETAHGLLRAGARSVLRSPGTTGCSASAQDRAALRLRREVRLLVEEPVRERALPAGRRPDVVVIGASTGGPRALLDILAGPPLVVPVLVAQHIRPGYAPELAGWLTSEGAPARVARHGERPAPGVLLLAPGDRDLALVDGRVELRPPRATAVPSVDVLFETTARVHGARVTAILLTGMGDDGAQGLLALRAAGAWTIAQRGDTCVVNGMPERARDLRASQADWTPAAIRAHLESLRGPVAVAAG
jgi:two-component system chemotaxis response regulator CheB